jgi:hypothetical protein
MKKRDNPQAAENDQIAATLASTQQTTARGLGVFLESLERSGFREAVKSYQQLQWVVLAQREWARSQRRRELDPGWKEIASHAESLHGLFSSMASALEPLRWVDGRPPKVPETAELEQKLAAWLPGALEGVLIRPSAEDLAHAESLVELGVLERKPRSRPPAFRLSAGLRARLAQAAAGMTPRPPGVS